LRVPRVGRRPKRQCRGSWPCSAFSRFSSRPSLCKAPRIICSCRWPRPSALRWWRPICFPAPLCRFWSVWTLPAANTHDQSHETFFDRLRGRYDRFRASRHEPTQDRGAFLSCRQWRHHSRDRQHARQRDLPGGGYRAIPVAPAGRRRELVSSATEQIALQDARC